MIAEPAICTGQRWLSIIGIGEDGVEGLSSVARRLIGSAELVVGGARHLELAKDLIRGRRLAWPSPMGDAFAEIKRCRGHSVAVLASGDPFHFGVGKQIADFVPAEEFVGLTSRFTSGADALFGDMRRMSFVLCRIGIWLARP